MVDGAETVFPATMEEARAYGAEIRKRFSRCVSQAGKDNISEALRLLESNPWLARDRQTQDAFSQLIKWHRKRGGSWSERRCRWSPAAIWAAVKALLREGEAASLEQTLQKLPDLIHFSYDSCKRQYYQALKEDRFRAALIEYPAQRRLVSDEEVQRKVGRACRLTDGPVTVPFSHPERGEIRTTVSLAKDRKNGTVGKKR
ncbi:MAG: hypothetical protein ACYCVY_04290 [Acidiferrobacteraceae bacterium]